MMGDPDSQAIVWVLGAGFSQPLDGPLLTDLFSPTSEKDLRERYGRSSRPTPRAASGSLEALFSPEVATVRWLYRYGLGLDRIESPDGDVVRGEPLWKHAEEFLEYLDTAAEQQEASNRPQAGRLGGILESLSQYQSPGSIDLGVLRAAAKRVIAAECCGFLEGANVRSEKWKPFRRWASALQPSDTVVTFNYDLVLEMLAEADNEDATKIRGWKPSTMHVVLPAPIIERRPLSGSCPVLKLHGSVNWQQTIDLATGRPNGTVRLADYRTMLAGDARFMALATPGPSKMEAALGFKSLWDLACERIKSAEAVVFVGFRFPETDAHPREVLFDAIAESARRYRHEPLQLHVVLGPNNEHAGRVKALLDFACRGTRTSFYGDATVHPLYSQDFLAVARREHLVP